MNILIVGEKGQVGSIGKELLLAGHGVGFCGGIDEAKACLERYVYNRILLVDDCEKPDDLQNVAQEFKKIAALANPSAKEPHVFLLCSEEGYDRLTNCEGGLSASDAGLPEFFTKPCEHMYASLCGGSEA